jgi:hypothetical protein
MNRKRITLTLVVLLTLFVLWRAFWRAASVLYLLYPAGILFGVLCGWLWGLSFLHWRGPALMIMLAAVLLAFYGLRREHLDLLLLSGMKNLEVRLPADATPRALIGFGFGCIFGVSAALLVNMFVNSWRGGRRPGAR